LTVKAIRLDLPQADIRAAVKNDGKVTLRICLFSDLPQLDAPFWSIGQPVSSGSSLWRQAPF